MPFRAKEDEGFGLVEVIIAMFLLAIIAMALLPVLWNGISQSSVQAATATATRELNARVERARATPTCPKIAQVTTSSTLYAGTPREFTVRVPAGAGATCSSGIAVPLSLEAVQGGQVIATVQAKVFVK